MVTTQMPTLVYGTDDHVYVSILQTMLRSLKYLNHVDGEFGPQTKAAVIAFQRDNGLKTDAVVGPITWAKLDALAPDQVLGEFGTEGDDTDGEWSDDGWWKHARRVNAAPGRVGGKIKPQFVVEHSTDMEPGTFRALVKAWSREKDAAGQMIYGACAHFIGGKTEADGVVQMISIYRNGNHAGGSRKLPDGTVIPYHGDWIDRRGARMHPNVYSIGIEWDNAGLLRRINGVWTHADSGYKFTDDQVFVDERGRGWERYTPYQRATFEQLTNALLAKCSPSRAVSIEPNGTYAGNGVPYAALGERGDLRVVGHATLNPNNKTDPGPEMMGWIRDRYKLP